MSWAQASENQGSKIQSIVGLRGYCCLAVVAVHFLRASQLDHGALRYPAVITLAFGAIGVTIFFLLSGYLITRALIETRDQDGFFSVFYAHRALRTLPAYYLLLIVIAWIDSKQGVVLDFHYWSHFLMMQNLLPGYAELSGAPSNQTAHLWSLAVEWQFYLVWPVIVWFVRKRETLLRVTWVLIAASWIFRLACPLLHITTIDAYFFTPSRIDAILFGAVLALSSESESLGRLKPFATAVALIAMPVDAVFSCLLGRSGADTYFGSLLAYTCIYASSIAALIAVLDESTVLSRICSGKWICRLGTISYGVYLYHFAIREWLEAQLIDRLTVHIHHSSAFLVIAAVGFVVTIALATLSYFLVELPALWLKDRVRYGRLATRSNGSQPEAGVLAKSLT